MMEFIHHGFFGSDELTRKMAIFCLICSFIGYLIGSINVREMMLIRSTKITEKSANNEGLFAIYGKKKAILIIACDILKCIIASVVARLLIGDLGAFFTGLFCIVGDAYPIYLKFKGGKGLLAYATMCLFTAPIEFAIILFIYLIILFGFKMSSLATVMSAIIFPLIFSKFHAGGIYVLIIFIASALVVFLHRKNIVAIYRHTEPKISIGRKK